MSAVDVPAVCDDCGTVFPSGIVFGDRVSGMMIGNKSGPCPRCGGMGSIPDGFYEVIGNVLNVVSTWAPDRLARLATTLERARNEHNPAVAEAVLKDDPELWGVVKQVVIPRDAAAFWAFVSALLMVLAILRGSG